MESLLELQKLLLSQFQKNFFYYRDIFNQINFDNKITGVIGTRGTGKTSFLLHSTLQANRKNLKALYVSADHIYFLENKLIDLVDRLYKETDVRLLCVDEIHKYPNWQQELKNISDFYLDFKIVFSGSSMIDIIHSKFDLSRRVTLYRLRGFSFREYLEFFLEVKLPRIDLKDLTEKHIEFSNEIDVPQILKHFYKYLEVGYFPFFEQFSDHLQLFQAIENTVQKTIYEDIATLHSLKTPTLLVIEKIYKYVIHSYPGEFNAYKLANALSKDYDNVSSYLYYLEQAGLINSLYKKQAGKAYLRNPVKLYPENSNLIYASHLAQSKDILRGKVREVFVLNQIKSSGLSIYYSEQGDFDVGEYVFEVGGKNKTRKQFKGRKDMYILADGLIVGAKDKLPLYLLGFIN